MKYVNGNKLEKLKINQYNTYFVIDFDKTITTNSSQDSWSVSGILLGEDFKKNMDELYKIYRPIELDYKIEVKEKEKAMRVWYEQCMSLYFKYNLTEEKIKISVQKSKMEFREGAKEFLQNAYYKSIPIVILSAGIGNVIEQFLNENECYFENMYIISNFFEFDKEGKVQEFDNSKIIHTSNKTMNGKIPQSFQEKLKSRRYKILIGDLREDENMVEKEEWDTTLKIGILKPETENMLEQYKSTFDIVLTEKEASFKDLQLDLSNIF